MKVYKTTDSNAELLADQLDLADSFFARAKGLLGRKTIQENQGLWIKPCRDIHTFFMSFSIDCIFLDRKMQIVKIATDVSPFKMVGPYWKSSSVMEFKSGFVETKRLKVGDQLYVVS